MTCNVGYSFSVGDTTWSVFQLVWSNIARIDEPKHNKAMLHGMWGKTLKTFPREEVCNQMYIFRPHLPLASYKQHLIP